MRRVIGSILGILILSGSTFVFEDKTVTSQAKSEPAKNACCSPCKCGLFMGVGGSYNSIRLDQKLEIASTAEVSLDDIVLATGEPEESTDPYHSIQSTFAPSGQFGYSYGRGCWVIGSHILYQYLGTTFTNTNLGLPFTELTNTDASDPDTIYAANVTTSSFQTTVQDELAWIFFLGHLSMSNRVYFGMGPAAFAVKSNLYNMIGTVDVGLVPLDILGSGVNFSKCQRVLGGAAQIGVGRYFNSWSFLDISYSFAFSKRFPFTASAPFTSENAGGLIDTGTLTPSSYQRIIVQSLAFILSATY